MNQKTSYDLTRHVLAILTVLLLIMGSLWVLAPFLGPLIWAVMIVIATWPLMLSVQQRLWGRRSLAVAVMVLALLMLLFLPLLFAVVATVEHVDDLQAAWPEISGWQPPEPPEWVARLPVAGQQLAHAWHELAVAGSTAVMAFLKPYAGVGLKWLAAKATGLGMLVVQFLLMVLLAGILYSEGEQAAERMRALSRRLAGAAGERIVTLAAQAVRGVALGIVVTALVQSVLGGLGLWVSGVPYAGLLTLAMLVCCLVQIGPMLILLPAVAWLFWTGDTGWGVALAVWSLVVGALDNVLRPWLIRKGADLPLLLIFAGVIGGLLAFGLIGLFVGPVLLAVTYTLLDAWVAEPGPDAPSLPAEAAEEAGSPPA